MTFCIGMKVRGGLVGIADTRIMSGTERTTARKVTVIERPGHAMFVMTSGLRSLRDKAMTYFEEAADSTEGTLDRVYKAVNTFAKQVRRVATEDRAALEESGLRFNLSALVGGQFENDDEHKLYLLYPEGNWVEVARATPYFVIGAPAYGKSLLDRALRYETSMEDALKVGYLAFDATRTSSTDVGFPIDVVALARDSFTILEHRYELEDLAPVSDWWQARVRGAIMDCPGEWVGEVFNRADNTVVRLDEPRA